MDLADLADLIRSRRSIRRWQDKNVPVGLLLLAIELATWAPNGGNQQNWYFYIILNQGVIEDIANVVQDKANHIASWPEMEPRLAAGIKERASLFRSAPAALAVATTHYQTPLDRALAAREKTDLQARQIREWRNIASIHIQSVAAAIAHLLLVLHQMGLGAVWMTGLLQAKGEIEKILRVPPELDIVAFIPVGYPAESPVSAGRKLVEEICEVIR